MFAPLRWMAAVVPMILGAGCASYDPKPLEPSAEFAALGRQSLGDFVVEHAKPGEGGTSAPVAFDPTDGLDETEVIAVALTLNPDLRAKRLEFGQARALLIEAGLWPNPEVGVGWRPGLGSAPGSTIDTDLLFELLTPWERSARVDAATARIEEVKAEIVAEEWRLVRETRSQLLDVLFREQVVALLEEEVKLRESALGLVKRRKELGEGAELDVSVAELELAEVRRDHRRAETERDRARRDLNRLLGLPPGYVLRLSDSGKPLSVTVYDELSDEELERRLLAGRFELRALEAAYQRAEHELRLAVYRQYPWLKIGPSFGKEPEGDNYLGIGASIQLPIFDRNQGQIAEKENQRERTRATYIATLHALRARAYEAWAQLQRARLEVEAQEKEVLPLVRRNQELFEGAFRARELNVLDWVTAQQRALRARQAYLDTLVRYRTAVIEIEAATGIPLSQPVPK